MPQAKTEFLECCAAETALQHSLFCSADVICTKSCAAANEKLHCNIEIAALQERVALSCRFPAGFKPPRLGTHVSDLLILQNLAKTAKCNDREATSQKLNNRCLRCMRFYVALWLRALFPLTAFKNARNLKFVQNLSQRLFWGVPVRGTEIWKNLSKFVRKLPFFKF